ncbi:MAG: sialidase family protein, partial [Ktedonobacterales bacterium]
SFTVSAETAQVSVLERSDDNGRTWTRADRGLGDNVLFSPPEIGRGDTLAVTVTHVPAITPGPVVTPGPGQLPHRPAPTTLWMSTDAGDTWRQVSTLPEGAGTFLLTSLAPSGSSGSTWPTADHPFYALEHEQIPSNLYRERVLMSDDGSSWTVLPPLPVPGVSAERPGVLQAPGGLPDGRLAVWGPDPQRGIPASESDDEQPFSAFWLWLWDPASQRWQVIPSPLETPAAEGCGLCWQAQTAVSRDGVIAVYVARLHPLFPGDPTQPGLFRMMLSAGG